MGSFRRLGSPFGDFSRFSRFGGGQNPGFRWNQFLNFEAGTTTPLPTAFDSVLGAGAATITVTAAAAIRDSYGLSVGIPNDTLIRYGRLISTGNLTKINCSFLFDLNGITMPNATSFSIVQLSSAGAGGAAAIVALRYTIAAGYSLSLATRNDAGGSIFQAPATILDQANEIEFEFKVSDAPGLNNGFANLCINGVLVATAVNIDNDTQLVTDKLFGAVGAQAAGTNGTIYFDNIRWSSRLR